MERRKPSEGDSLPADSRGRDSLGDRKKLTDQEAPTLWRRQREGLFRRRKETDRARGTHLLETAEGDSC